MKFPAWVEERLRRRTQVYLLPTREGLWWLGTVLLIFLIGLGYSNNLCLALAMLLFALTVVLLLEAHFNLEGVVLRELRVEDQFLERWHGVHVQLAQGKSKERQALMLAPDGSEAPEAQRLEKHDQRYRTRWRFSRRGVFRAQHLVLSSRYPLGLFRAWSYHPCELAVWVYPRLGNSLPSLPYSLAAEQNDQASVRGEEDLAGLRPYAAGDTLSRVDWKTLARGLPLHTREFEGTSGARVQFHWPLARVDESELSAWASLLQRLNEEQRPWELVLPEGPVVDLDLAARTQLALRLLAEAP